ncbi:hypothetical protein [Corynebacterium pacaense]|uniref:hypothetical protein n=1 Tax=Corynebacterium pacaense TaxID=1816684 RepID=UPI001177ABAB|nr:hypothetical protein [Corynebacterium pacaense]
MAVFMTVIFQSHFWDWGGIIRFFAQAVFLVFIALVTRCMVTVRRVHPLGHRRLIIAACALPMAAVVIGGWFWIVPLNHGTSWMITTAVAVVSCLPLAVVGLRLIRQGKK